MRRLIALFACALLVADAISADSHDAAPKPAAAAESASKAPENEVKPITAASVPKIESIKPNLKEAAMETAKSEAAAVKAEAAAAKQAAAQRELALRIAARVAALRKERAKAQHKATAHAAAKGAADGHALHWSYEGEGGPLRWGKLDPAWAKCENGTRQSPIDIRDGIKVDLEQVNFDYKPARFSVVDNGHTIQVNIGGGNQIRVMGRRFDLVQFHFHRPSEERVNGQGFQMVAHLIHRDMEGKLAVVAVLIEEGKAHSLVQSVWNNLPLEKNEALSPAMPMDLNELLPERREYYTYMGSLTTPPCSEGVLWIVLKEPIQISSQQIAVFARLYPMNARPIQIQAGRLIKESN